jgi:spermidine/putrescine transport system substrate-binding protein
MSSVKKLSTRSVNRRDALKIGAGAGAAAALATGFAGPAAAQEITLEVMLPNAIVSGKCKEIMEKAAGVKISDAPFQSTPDAVSRLLAPGGTSRLNINFGIVDFARQPILGPSAGSEKVSALDLSKIPNFAKLSEPYKPAIIERGGKVYGVPVLLGYNTVLYNTESIKAEDPDVQTWGALFNDKYAGKIGWFENAHQMMFAAAMFLGKEKPSTMTDAEVREVGNFMISKKKNVRIIWTSFSQCANLFATGEMTVAFGTLPVLTQLAQQGMKVNAAWPKEGVESLIGTVFVPKDSSNQDKSHAVINAMLSDEYAKELPKAAGYLSPNPAGAEGLTKEQMLKAGYGINTGETKNLPMPIPANLNVWVEVWSKIKSA